MLCVCFDIANDKSDFISFKDGLENISLELFRQLKDFLETVL